MKVKCDMAVKPNLE